jgi:hypothetical protein
MTTKVSIGLGGTGSNSAASTLTSIGAVAKSGDTMTGALLLAAGSNTAPAISRSTDTDTGIYFPAANEMAITTGGTVAQAFNSNGVFFRNRIINGDMRIDQRAAGAVSNPSGTSYTVDRWGATGSVASKFTLQQSNTVPSGAGFINSLLATSSSAYTVGAAEAFLIRYVIEGTNVADLGWGTASARTVTLSFWVRSSLTGTFGGSLRNSAVNRSYPFSYTISAADTWEYKTITIPGDTTGTWLTDTGIGISVSISLGAGATLSGTAGAWVGSNLWSTTGAVSVVGTNGATFYITGVQLETGSVATPFERRPYGTELMLCQRYFEKGSFVSATAINTGGIYPSFPFKVTKRVAAGSCTSTNSRSLTLTIINDDSTSGLAASIYQNSNDSAPNITYFTVSAEL